MVSRHYTKFDMRTRSFIHVEERLVQTEYGFTKHEHVTLWTDPEKGKRMHDRAN